jgi:hypothetical protein
MFKTMPAIADTPVVIDPPDSVPCSHLSLDLPEPAGGWVHYLPCRGIEVVTDDIGRKAISRADAKQLFDECREAEVRRRENEARLEAEAIRKDREWRAGLPRGAAWYDMPAGELPASVMLQQAKDAERTTPTQGEWLFGETNTMSYHEYGQDEAS